MRRRAKLRTHIRHDVGAKLPKEQEGRISAVTDAACDWLEANPGGDERECIAAVTKDPRLGSLLVTALLIETVVVTLYYLRKLWRERGEWEESEGAAEE